MTNDVSVCNSALIKIGASRIVSLTEDNPRAVFCAEQLPKLSAAVLRAHPWRFATKRVQLGQLSTPPLFGYNYQYQLPTDCLKVQSVQDPDIEYKVEGRFLLSDESGISIKYTSLVDASMYDATFSEALSCRLAADLAYVIAQNSTLASTMYALYKEILSEARTMDAQESTPEPIYADEWLQARF